MDIMPIVKNVIIFVIIYISIYLFYFFSVVNPQIRFMNGKVKKQKEGKKTKPKKEKKEHNDLLLLKTYYKVDIEKIGVIRVLRILNAVNALVLTIMVMLVLPLKQDWLKMLIIAILMLPTIWVTYYFIAKYLKYLERKSE